MTDYGAEFAVNGVRPRFVRDEDSYVWTTSEWDYDPARALKGTARNGWAGILAIKLPADHPQYLVAQHPGMVMHTTDARPVDFDASKPVLLVHGNLGRSGECADDWCWSSNDLSSIIGYHPLPASPSVEQGPSEFRSTPDDVPQWALDRAHSITNEPVNDGVIDAFARYIAQHETPPVDEATELWAGLVAVDDPQRSVRILRAYLAKVRGETA